MLNLIKNEYAKIFHKVSTYILLVLLLLGIIGMPLLSKLTSKLGDSILFFISYDDEITWAEEFGDKPYAEILKKAKELDIPENEAFGDGKGWRYKALDTLYYNYWIHFALTDEEMAEYYGYEDDFIGLEEEGPSHHVVPDEVTKAENEKIFNEGIKYVEDNDWKGYYQFHITLIENDESYTDIEKKYQKYSYQYMIDNDIEPGAGSWQEEALSTYVENVQVYEELKVLKDAGEYYDEKSYDSAEKLTLIAKYRLDNKVNEAIYEFESEDIFSDGDIYTFDGDLYKNMKSCISVLMIVLIISIIIAGNIISKEFSQGTIKFLLINPVKRSKIFWSKYITVFSYAFLLTAATFFLEFIMSIIVYGTSGLGTQVLVIEAGKVVANSAFGFMAFRYLLAFVEIFIAFTIAFMISSLFRNSALAITISMIVYFVGTTVCQVAALFNLDFFRYTIFAAQDLTSIINGKSSFIHMTSGFALAIIVTHVVLLLLTAHDAFTKKNV